jgi:DNA polymerase-3 subunit delta
MAKKPASKQTDAPAKKGAEKPAGPATWRIALFHGKDSFQRAERTREVREALIAAHGEIDSPHFDGSSCLASDVLDECRSFGLIARHKLVIVDNADDLIKDTVRALFERYAESPTESATLVLRSDTWRPGNLDKAIAKVGIVEKLELLKDPEARAWVIERAKAAHNTAIEKDGAALLVERVGADLAKLDSELGKLAAAAAGGPITAQHVSYFTGASREEEVWSIQGTLLNAGPEEALQHLRYVLDVSRQPEQLVLWAIIDLARKVHGACRALKSGASPAEISRPLKLWGSSQFAIIEAAKRTTPGRALRLYRACIEADMRSKRGLGDIDRTLERLAVRFSMLMRA